MASSQSISFNLSDPASVIPVFEHLLATRESKTWAMTGVVTGKTSAASTAILYYYNSLNLLALAQIDIANRFATALAFLIGGFTNSDRPEIDNGIVALPRSYLSKFPHVERLFREYQADNKALRSRFQAALSVEAANSDLGLRQAFQKNAGAFDYWPVRLDRRAEPDGSERSLDCKQIASLIIDDMLAKSLPANFSKRKRTESVVTLGSCFALNISQALQLQGIQCRPISVAEIANSPKANVLLLDYILNGQSTETDFFSENITDEVRYNTLDDLKACSTVVLTVGVAAILERIADGRLFLGEGARKLITEEHVRQRMTTVDENADAITRIMTLIRSANPRVDIFVTLSPVPLLGVGDNSSVMMTDLISKSTLRLAIKGAQERELFHYWPSFEAVKWIAPHVPTELQYQSYGADDKNSRHVSRWIIDILTQKFIEYAFEN